MTLRYEDALQETLEASDHGTDVTTLLATHPEHAEDLRDDLDLIARLAAVAESVPPATPLARNEAAGRMTAQLEAERASARPMPWWRFGGPGLPRYAVAVAVALVAVVGFGLLFDGRGATVEARTIEGIVVENAGGVLTMQTLDALETVRLPDGARVDDGAGTAIEARALEPGQVVVVDVERWDEDVTAVRVRRQAAAVEAWCAGDLPRCLALSQRLEATERECRPAATCGLPPERLVQLVQRLGESVRVERLKLACRDGVEAACRVLDTLCRERGDACPVPSPAVEPERPAVTPQRPAVAPTATDRPQEERRGIEPTPTSTPSAAEPAPESQRPVEVASPVDARPSATPVTRPSATEEPVPTTTEPALDTRPVETARPRPTASPVPGLDTPQRVPPTQTPEPTATTTATPVPTATPLAPATPQPFDAPQTR